MLGKDLGEKRWRKTGKLERRRRMCVAPVSERKGQFKEADNAVAEREDPEGTMGANESGVEPGGVQYTVARATWTWTGRALW